MGTKQIKVVLKPGHEVILQSDAPNIGELIEEIVKVKDAFNPNEVEIECDYDGFDKASFRQIVIDATEDFLEAIRLDKEAYEKALEGLKS